MIPSNAKQSNNKGFTLIEMIVVIVILGILASAAVYGISGYIDLTRFNGNEENALSVFQSAQNAINHMEASGSSEQLIADIIASGTPDEYDPFNYETNDHIFNKTIFDTFPSDPAIQKGQSVHMRYSLTHIPGEDSEQSRLVRELISEDLRSTDILSGCITIEVDIEKVLDSYGVLHYSANIYSVFCDSGRVGWDSVSKNGLASVVPYRDHDYRRSSSLVGYTAVTEAAASVDTVYVPADMEIQNTFVTLRNGETLDLTWSATKDTLPVTGVPAHIHYTFSIYDDDTDLKFCDLVVNENSIIDGIPKTNLETDSFYEKLKFDKSIFPAKEGYTSNVIIGSHNYTVVYSSEKVVDSRGIPITVYKATIHTSAKVYVRKVPGTNYAFDYNDEGNRLLNESNYYTFPLSISYEVHEGDGVSDRISYTLSLDAMMSRNIINNAENSNSGVRTLNYSFGRLLSSDGKLPKNSVPKNIYVMMVAAPDNIQGLASEYSDTTGFTESDPYYAQRALTDPVYLQPNGTYSYSQLAVNKENGKNHAVVNMYFGDLGDGSLGSHEMAVGGNAVITSFRHLSNIRLLRNYSQPVEYSIQRDLNWYVINRDSLGNETYSSDVVVYSADGTGSLKRCSPVPVVLGHNYGEVLNVVSFPSIPTFPVNAVLRAVDNLLSHEDDKTSVINNLQMRMPSFYSSNLDGYGMICVNYGTIANIRANGWTVSVTDTPDGSPDDRNNLRTSIDNMINGGNLQSTEPAWKGSSPLGCLVGANNGILGLKNSTGPDETTNTIRFSNCIATTGEYISGKWMIHRLSACGIIIGDNNGNAKTVNSDATLNISESLYGNLEVTGNFVSAGCIYVGTAIGYSMASIDARITVDNTLDTDKAIIKFNNFSSLVYGMSDAVGGAVGSMDNKTAVKGHHFYQNTTRLSYSATPDGRLAIAEASSPVYAIDVRLDSRSYIMMDGFVERKENKELGIGGAVGRIERYNGDILSIRVINDGIILSSNNTNYVKHMGGAVGYILDGSIGRLDIYVINNGKVGSSNGTDPVGYTAATGGAVGKIHQLAGRTGICVIYASNRGGVFGNSTLTEINNNNTAGVGGAVGAINGGSEKMPKYFIMADNRCMIHGLMPIFDATNEKNRFGVGGAVGYLDYMPRASCIYSKMAAGSSLYSSGNNAGGAIGCQYYIYSENPSGNKTYITADLTNTSVHSGGNNGGGTIGYSRNFQWYTSVRTYITGNVSVTASSNAGGSMGAMTQNASSEDSELILRSLSADSVLSIRASSSVADDPAENNDNAGGLIGHFYSGGSGTQTLLSLPTQTGTDNLRIDVDSYNNSGGMIGCLQQRASAFSSDMSVVLHPDSHIQAHNDNAGGVIGLLEMNGRNLESDMNISRSGDMTTLSVPSITAVGNNAGGCIGNVSEKVYVKGNLTADMTGIRLSGTDNVGGCIGRITNGELDENASLHIRGSGIIISGHNQVSGCIGYAISLKINGAISFSADSAEVKGNDNVGGCIGKFEGGSMVAGSEILYDSSDSVVNGAGNVGGCIGYIANKPWIEASILYKGSNNSVSGTSDCIGGLIGLSESKFGGSAVLKYLAADSRISGQDNVGGMIGCSKNGESYYQTISMEPSGSCSVEGRDKVGGCIGNISSGSKNFQCYPQLNLSESSVLTIKGKNNTGGIAGYLNDAGYWGSVIKLTYGARLNITSSDSVAGGHIGYMISANLGEGSYTNTYCGNGANITISGINAAGGCIGIAATNKNNNPVMKIELTGADSSINITASGNEAGAGYAVGINGSTFGKANDITFTGNGSIHISAPAGYAGAYMGINNMRYNGNSSYTFTDHVIFGGHINEMDDTEPLTLLIGKN